MLGLEEKVWIKTKIQIFFLVIFSVKSCEWITYCVTSRQLWSEIFALLEEVNYSEIMKTGKLRELPVI